MAKKTIPNNNPVLQFMSTSTLEAHTQADTQAEAYTHTQAEAYTHTQAEVELITKAEPKSKRVQLLMQQTVFDKLKATAEEKNTSVNELVNYLVKKYLEDK